MADALPTLMVTLTGALGLIWTIYQWFNSKTGQIHEETEKLLRDRLEKTDTDLSKAIESKRDLHQAWEKQEQNWEDERRSLQIKITNLTTELEKK